MDLDDEELKATKILNGSDTREYRIYAIKFAVMQKQIDEKDKRIKDLEEENRIYVLNGNNVKLEIYIKDNYIPKQKIKENYLKMEKEYERKVYDNNYNITEVKKEEFYKRQVYEELLEDK